jgi:hypothetical protein
MSDDRLQLAELLSAKSQNVSLMALRESPSWVSDLTQSQMLKDVTHVSLARVRGFAILQTHLPTKEPRLSGIYYILSDNGQSGTRCLPTDGMGWSSRGMTPNDTSYLRTVISMCDEILARETTPMKSAASVHPATAVGAPNVA